ncbi:amino acid permease [Bacillus spizizenii]|uniref:amino acid permease n=1 Tax=Bacillus spizizenii TaxID=96241 RepID=UPI0005EDDF65|nr:amino acid permease [Bacillus spizizenii]MDU7576040.1 amino acid permease [Bacillus subtilis]MCY7809581.1 amino acid permease [Bacillus spizizenii]MCY7854644.1 amino acid permease [Bacillus spizizenii]MCY8057305.1 amino acid permease [Bacillus spizizenii]MCY8112507.1 amino acid permease [Bacillus spizizenii]
MSSLFRKKPLETLSAQSKSKSLARTLSAFDLTLLGIGCVIGTGIFVITGTVAATGAGPALIISFILAGLACALAAFCYAEFSSSIPISGSVYSYSYVTLGELLAFLIGWDLMLEYVIALSAVATGWSSYFQSLLAGFNLHIPAALTGAPGSTPGAVFNLPAAVIILIITAIVSRGVKESTRFNNVIVLMKIGIILLFIIVGIGYVKPDNWSPFMPFGMKGVIVSAATVFFAYLGFDAVSNASEEVKNPQKNMPVGIISALAVCTVLYITVSLVLTGMMPYTKLNVGDPVSFALKFVDQDAVAGIISVGAIIGITTVMLALLYAQVRLTFAMSRDGLLPGLFAKVHPSFKTPFRNTWLTGIVAAGIAGFINLGTLAHLVNMGTLAAFTVISIAVIVLRKKYPEIKASFRVPFVPVVPIISAGICLWFMYSLPGVTWLSFVIWIAVGALVYFLYSRKHSLLNK